MSTHHTPREPPQEFLDYFRTSLRIDTARGQVFLGDVELGAKNTVSGRIVVAIRVRRGLRRAFFRYHIIWWAAKGYWPRMTIDHSNTIQDDDRIDNLTEMTQAANCAKRRRKQSTHTLPVVEETFARLLKYRDTKG